MKPKETKVVKETYDKKWKVCLLCFLSVHGFNVVRVVCQDDGKKGTYGKKRYEYDGKKGSYDNNWKKYKKY